MKIFFGKLLLLPIFYFQGYADFIKVICYIKLYLKIKEGQFMKCDNTFSARKYYCLVFEVQ